MAAGRIFQSGEETMCDETGLGYVIRCKPYELGHMLAGRWAWGDGWAHDGDTFREAECTRARELCDGTTPLVVNINDAAEELFYRLRPLVRGNREAAAWFWLHEVGATPAEFKSHPHFYQGFAHGCADALGTYHDLDDGPP